MKDIKNGYYNKLNSKLYGLLCEFEKDGEWEAFLDSILLELMGIKEENRTIDYYILTNKLSTLRYVKYQYFRSTIFDCMTLISRGGIEKDELP